MSKSETEGDKGGHGMTLKEFDRVNQAGATRYVIWDSNGCQPVDNFIVDHRMAPSALRRLRHWKDAGAEVTAVMAASDGASELIVQARA
jgi:hypothetical protein